MCLIDSSQTGETMNKTYFVSFKCLNCKVWFEREFEFGRETPADTEIKCENCGCFTCHKEDKFRALK